MQACWVWDIGWPPRFLGETEAGTQGSPRVMAGPDLRQASPGEAWLTMTDPEGTPR